MERVKSNLNRYEVILNVKTKMNKEELRKELIPLFRNTIVKATHITIRREEQ